MEAMKLLEECCQDHHAGLPGAKEKLLKLWDHLPWITAAKRRDQGAAWLGFREAVEQIAHPLFRPAVNYTTYVHNRIERQIKEARRADWKPLVSPSQSTVTRYKKTGKRLAYQSADLEWLDEQSPDTETDSMRNILEDALTPRQKDIYKMLAAGHTQKQVAASLGISDRTVRRHMKAVSEAALAV